MENWSNPDFGCWCGATCLPCQNMPWEQAHSSVLHCNLHGTKKGRNLNYRKQSTKFHRETKKRFKRHCSCCASLFEKSWGSDAHNIHAPPHPPQKQQLASISSILPPPKKKKTFPGVQFSCPNHPTYPPWRRSARYQEWHRSDWKESLHKPSVPTRLWYWGSDERSDLGDLFPYELGSYFEPQNLPNHRVTGWDGGSRVTGWDGCNKMPTEKSTCAQMIIFHQPRFLWYEEMFLSQLHFGGPGRVRSPEEWL